MRLHEFLNTLSAHPNFAVQCAMLGAMGGHAAGAARYFSTVEQSFSALDPTDPLWFVPIGVLVPGRVIGLDARPESLGVGGFPILERFERGALVTTAFTLPAHVRGQLIRATVLGVDPPRVAGERAYVERLTGSPLWRPGQLDGVRELPPWQWSLGDRSPYTAVLCLGKDRKANAEILRLALERSPTAAHLWYAAAAAALHLGDTEAHHDAAARGAVCPQWTRFRTDPTQIAMSLELASLTHPELVPPELFERLRAPGDERWRAACAGAWRSGELLLAVTLAVDLAYFRGLDAALADGLLRPLFTELGWAPALRLLDFRQEMPA